MTTTYDTEFSTETFAVSQYDDPDTYTVAEAWASSLLGEIGDDYDSAAADTADDRNPAGSRAKLFAALASGIIGGATLGAVLFGDKAVNPPTVVVPGFGVSTEQLPAAPSTPNSPQTPQTPAAAQVPSPISKPVEQAAVPNPIAAESKTNEEVAAAPADPGTPPVFDPPVVVDVYVPPLGDKPEQPAPEPPKPQPPAFDPPNIDVVQAVPDGPIVSKPEQPNLQVNEDLFAQPVDSGSRWTTKLPENKPNTRRAPTSSRATIAKP